MWRRFPSRARVHGLLAACLSVAQWGCDGDDGPSQPGVGNIEVTGPDRIVVGTTERFRADAFDVNGQMLFSDTGFTWSSGQPAIATVDQTGNVTGVAPGTATIRASAGAEGLQGEATTEVVAQSPGQQLTITGRVVDGTTGAGLANATVTFFRGDYGGEGEVARAVTGADGGFTTPPLLAPVALNLTATANGYVTATMGRVIPAGQPLGGTLTIETIPMVPAGTGAGGIEGNVRNARDRLTVAGATVNLFRGMRSDRAEDQLATTTADGSGHFAFVEIPPGTYNLTASSTAFTPGSRTGISVSNQFIRDQDVLLSPSGTTDVRIVLTWGREPADVDAHLTGPLAGGRFHIFWRTRGELEAPPYARLDVDNQTSFGPETITITRLEPGTYRYSVHDFTNAPLSGSSALGNSGAKVELYLPNRSAPEQFFVPRQGGTLWTVFELSGTAANPVVTRINTMTNAEDSEAIPAPPAAATSAATDAGVIGRAVRGDRASKK